LRAKTRTLALLLAAILFATSFSGCLSLMGGGNDGGNQGKGGQTGPSIAVTYPLNGSWCAPGDICSIRWTSTGSVPGTLSIQIDYASHDSPCSIDAAAPNSGRCDWPVPLDFAPRADYRITITSNSNCSVQAQSGLFTISDGSSGTASITVSSPNASSIWLINTQHTIAWNSSGTVGEQVKIEFDSISHSSLRLIANTSNDGAYEWTVPVNLKEGQYLVRVSSATGPILDESAWFQIATSFSPATIHIIAPQAGVQVQGGACSIDWTSSGAVGSALRIECDHTSYSAPQLIVASTPNDGHYTWDLPSNISLREDYFIRVSSLSNLSVFDDSAMFAIRSPLAPPILLVPADGVSVPGTPIDFAWEPVAGASQYRFQIDDAPSFSSPILDKTMSSSHYQHRGTFTDGATYYWRAMAGTEGSWGAASAAWSFTYATGNVSRHFSWSYGGSDWTWDLSIPVSTYQDYRELSRTYDWGTYITSTDPVVAGMAQGLHDKASLQGWGALDTVSFVLAFVQSLPYMLDNVTTGLEDYPRYPVETLVDNGGDCEDTAMLFAALLQAPALNYDCVLLLIPYGLPTHMATGVWGSSGLSGTYFTYNERNYYYCETTGEGWTVGEIPDEYRDARAQIVDV